MRIQPLASPTIRTCHPFRWPMQIWRRPTAELHPNWASTCECSWKLCNLTQSPSCTPCSYRSSLGLLPSTNMFLHFSMEFNAVVVDVDGSTKHDALVRSDHVMYDNLWIIQNIKWHFIVYLFVMPSFPPSSPRESTNFDIPSKIESYFHLNVHAIQTYIPEN